MLCRLTRAGLAAAQTLSYYGNDVKQLAGCEGPSCSYKGVLGHPHIEALSDGEFWPIIDQAATVANVRGEDLYSSIAVSRGAPPATPHLPLRKAAAEPVDDEDDERRRVLEHVFGTPGSATNSSHRVASR